VPTRLKIIKGTDQPCRINRNEPKPSTDNIKMPSGLSPAAKKHWRIICKQLENIGLMTVLDVPALAMYCEVFARWMDANKNIAKYGAIIKSANGFPVQSPYMQVANKAFEQMRSMLIEFGMTPSSRTKVSATSEKKPKNPWNEI